MTVLLWPHWWSPALFRLRLLMAMKGLGLEQGQRGWLRTHLLDARCDGLGGRRAARADVPLTPMRLELYALQQPRPRHLE
ncbi:hypothetical protein [Mumia zhuanghuii]|uniref:Uncharacterized protein n=1 Tax=Mumia zhuanghuii TaxID=2585211 RepID=A0A5C4MB24_9ACTN|nr:hypothetical protein [Mumia zhuanghuii]TNC33511.1 hypothetical protein FHE65_28900 [Mumia zhuanghuii]